MLHTWLVTLAIGAVRGYQLLFAAFSGGACRFDPSCSAYAADALRTHGLVRGGWLALGRVSRCHPWGPFGWDPVPPAEARPPRAVRSSTRLAINREPADGVEGPRRATSA